MAGPTLGYKRARSFRRQPMAEINVTPFVDVMLVLLVVFMITAPMMTQGVQVSLPQVDNAQMTDQNEPLIITIKRSGQVYLQEIEVSAEELMPRLRAIRDSKPGTAILLRADSNVAYGEVMRVMGAFQNAGLVDVGLVTEPAAQ